MESLFHEGIGVINAPLCFRVPDCSKQCSEFSPTCTDSTCRLYDDGRYLCCCVVLPVHPPQNSAFYTINS